MKTPVIAAISSLVLAACSVNGQRPVGFAATLPAPMPVEEIIAPADGTIFSSFTGYAPLHNGNRAARVGDLVQVVVPAGRWQAARSLGGWTLVSCTVSPGFRFDSFELAPPGWELPSAAG